MTPADTIRARLEQLAAIEKTYTEYAHQRLSERDWHGLWDVAVNLSEVSCERDGLQLALGAFDKEEQPKGECLATLNNGCTCALPVGHVGGHSCDARHPAQLPWEPVAPPDAPQLAGPLPACSCEPYQGRKDGHRDNCAMVVKAKERHWVGIEMVRTPFGAAVYDRRFER